jgi:hypothetical protein
MSLDAQLQNGARYLNFIVVLTLDCSAVLAFLLIEETKISKRAFKKS